MSANAGTTVDCRLPRAPQARRRRTLLRGPGHSQEQGAGAPPAPTGQKGGGHDQQNYPPQASNPRSCSLAGSADVATMPKGFNLRCATGKTARVWPQGKGGALTPGRAFVLLPIREGETEGLPVGYRAPLRQATDDFEFVASNSADGALSKWRLERRNPIRINNCRAAMDRFAIDNERHAPTHVPTKTAGSTECYNPLEITELSNDQAHLAW
jgi:hypothetical protein